MDLGVYHSIWLVGEMVVDVARYGLASKCLASPYLYVAPSAVLSIQTSLVLGEPV